MAVGISYTQESVYPQEESVSDSAREINSAQHVINLNRRGPWAEGRITETSKGAHGAISGFPSGISLGIFTQSRLCVKTGNGCAEKVERRAELYFCNRRKFPQLQFVRANFSRSRANPHGCGNSGRNVSTGSPEILIGTSESRNSR